MRRLMFVGALSLLGLVAGLVLQPDDGTAVQHGEIAVHSVVAGANHAKPLPRIVTLTDLVSTLALAVGVVALAAVARPAIDAARLTRGQWYRRTRLRSFALAQRGPPTFA